MIALGPIILLIDGREVHGTVTEVRDDDFDVDLGADTERPGARSVEFAGLRVDFSPATTPPPMRLRPSSPHPGTARAESRPPRGRRMTTSPSFRSGPARSESAGANHDR